MDILYVTIGILPNGYSMIVVQTIYVALKPIEIGLIIHKKEETPKTSRPTLFQVGYYNKANKNWKNRSKMPIFK